MMPFLCVHQVSTQRDVYKGDTSSIENLNGHSRCSLERYIDIIDMLYSINDLSN